MLAKIKEALGLGPVKKEKAIVKNMSYNDCCGGGADFLVKFQLESGKNRQLIVSEKTYLKLKVGQKGELHYSGWNFHRFE